MIDFTLDKPEIDALKALEAAIGQPIPWIDDHLLYTIGIGYLTANDRFATHVIGLVLWKAGFTVDYPIEKRSPFPVSKKSSGRSTILCKRERSDIPSIPSVLQMPSLII